MNTRAAPAAGILAWRGIAELRWGDRAERPKSASLSTLLSSRTTANCIGCGAHGVRAWQRSAHRAPMTFWEQQFLQKVSDGARYADRCKGRTLRAPWPIPTKGERCLEIHGALQATHSVRSSPKPVQFPAWCGARVPCVLTTRDGVGVALGIRRAPTIRMRAATISVPIANVSVVACAMPPMIGGPIMKPT